MAEKFKSKALEANLAETRYKDIKIDTEYQAFIDLSKKYFGINKRANDCIIEFQHPFSNKKFVAEELRKILLTDYWYYIALKEPENAFEIPINMIKKLLLERSSEEFHVMIIKTILEFIQKLAKEEVSYNRTIESCSQTLRSGLKEDTLSFIKASKFFNRYLNDIVDNQTFGETQIGFFAIVGERRDSGYRYQY